MEKEKIQKAWEKFRNKMTDLKKRQQGILTHISDEIDAKRMEVLRKKMQDHE